MTTSSTSLDDLYRMTAHIYSEQNAQRPVSSTFAHFVEVCGMLTIHDRRKKKEGINLVGALCKALGWYFPLLAKLRVRSVEELIFRKYPGVCPYCRLAPHEDGRCKSVRGTDSTVDHVALRRAYEANRHKRPRTLDEWQSMFQRIYPRSPDERARSTLGLFEEVGELAEAVRVFDRYPKYFIGEAADTFSYLMGIANELSLRMAQDADLEFSLQDEFLRRYPGLCTGCGNRVCVCPSIPRSTVGRMSKELDIDATEQMFERSEEDMLIRGGVAASAVLQSLGGHRKLVEGFPTDRGDANSALILLCMKLATAVETSNLVLSERLRAAAIELGSSTSAPGTLDANHSLATKPELITALREVWREVQSGSQSESLGLSASSLASELGASISKLRILFVFASPKDQDPLRVASELRIVRKAIASSKMSAKVELDDAPAATVEDLRHALLNKEYEFLHFAGHANGTAIVLENSEGDSAPVPLAALRELIEAHKSIRCVILNACKSLSELTTPLAAYTIGMEGSVDDDSAVEFARGFYEAICCAKSIEFAVREGETAAKLKNLDPPKTKVIEKTAQARSP
jgi:NTP pyrophosphatase (non-canonical NTP hydrolase)